MQSVTRRWTRIAARLAISVVLINGLGCAFGEVYWDDPMKREYSLGEVQKRYSSLVRFGAIGQASKFVDPELSSTFIESFPNQGELIFTDHESGQIEFTGVEGDRKTAEVKVTYSAYHTFSLVVFEVTEIQEWYRDGAGNSWLVRPRFEGLEEFAAAN
jgi:hypothetical protein